MRNQTRPFGKKVPRSAPLLRTETLESRELLAHDLAAASIVMQALSRGYLGATSSSHDTVVTSQLGNTQSAPSTPVTMSQVSSSPIVTTITTSSGGSSVEPASSLSADSGPAVIASAATPNDLVAIRLAVTDAAGNALSTVNIGDTFQLRGYVRSINNAANSGVFAAFVDVEFNAALVNASGLVGHGTQFVNGTSGTLLGGVMDEVGGIQGLTIADPTAEGLLFQQTFTATGSGTLTFNSNPADTLPIHNTLTFDPPATVSPNDIDYGSISVQIQNPGVQDLVQFAKNLKSSGATLYGAAWDTATTAQKEIFQDGASYLNFVDVTNPDRSNKPIATEKSINTKPTWIFGNGQRLEGVRSLAEIATASGISIPTSDTPSMVAIGAKAVLAGSPLLVAVDGYDPNNGPLTYSVSSSNPALITPSLVPQTDKSLRMSVAGYGDMVFKLFDDRVPRVTSHIEQLANSNFYDNVTFHRVVNNFVIQGGDPTGTGSGGSNLGEFDDQFDVDLQHNQTGILSMAKTDDDTNDSQFFITEGAQRHLDFNHSIFGYLVEGESIRSAISDTPVDTSSKPTNTVTMNDVIVFNDTENAVMMLKAANGATGTATITVTATNASGKSVTQTFTVNISADTVNSAPFLKDFAQTTYVANHDVPITIPFDATDLEGDAITYKSVIYDGPKDAKVVVDSTAKTATVTPSAGFAGDMRVIIGAFPPSEASVDTQILTTHFNGIDLWQDSDSGFDRFDNLTNANTLEIRVSGVASNASVKLLRNGTEVGTAVANSNGTAVFSYDATADTDKLTFTAEVTVSGNTTALDNSVEVTLDRTLPGPVTTADPTSVKKGQDILYNIENGLEGSFDEIYSLTEGPTGSKVDAKTGLVNWVVPFGYTDPTATFKIKIQDKAGNFISHDFTVNVLPADKIVDFSVRVLDLQGNPITSIAKGNQFQVEVLVNDLRTSSAGNNNLFNAFVDMSYNASLVGIPSGAPLTLGPNFATSQLKSGTNTQAGLIDEAGGTNSVAATGAIVVFSQVFVANNPGTVTFATARAVATSNASIHNVTVTNPTKTPDLSEIQYGTAQLAVFDGIFANADAYTVAEDSIASPLNVMANDLPAGIGTITAVGAADHGGTVTIAANGLGLLYTPAANFAGTETFTYTLTSNGTSPSTGTVTMTVTNVNDPPTATNDAVQVAQNQTNVSLPVLSNDSSSPDSGETLTIVSVTQGTQGGTITIANDGLTVNYTPPSASYLGSDTFTYTISDGHQGTATATVTVDVTTPAPEGIDLVNASDTGVSNTDNITKATTMDVVVTGVTVGASVKLFANGTAYGNAVTATGTSVNFTVDATTFTNSLVLTATQTASGSTSGPSLPLTITIDRTAPSTISTTPPDAAFVGVPFTYTAQSADPVAKFSLTGAPASATINPTTGVVAWTPSASDVGTKSFTVVASDVAGNETTQAVSVNVYDKEVHYSIQFLDQDNNPITSIGVGSTFTMQIFVDDLRTQAATPGIASAFTQISFPDPFVDAIGTPILDSRFGTGSKVGAITSGQIAATGGTYTPSTGSADPVPLFSQKFRATALGNATFLAEFVAGDAFATTVKGQTTKVPAAGLQLDTKSMTVVAGLTGIADAITVDEDSTTTIDVLANDTVGPTSGTRTITTLSTPSQGGTVTVVESGQKIRYVPKANFFGTETFTYIVKDASDATTAATTVTITVSSINDPPVATDDSGRVLINADATTFNVLANDTFAPDLNETLTITAVSAGDHGGTIERISNNTALRYKPATDFSGTETFTYTVSDGNGGTDTATLVIVVEEFHTSQISGSIFRDSNGNGVFDSGELALAGLEVRLDGTDSDGVTVHRTTRTVKTGEYTFSDVAPGNYTVTQAASQVLSAPAVLSSNPSSAGGISITTSNQGGTLASNNFGAGGLAPTFSVFGSLASNKTNYVEFASNTQGTTEWQMLDSVWSQYSSVEFTLSADASSVTINATQTNGTQLSDMVSTQQRSLVQVIGQIDGARLVRVVGTPTQFNLHPVTSATTALTASATQASALDAYFASF